MIYSFNDLKIHFKAAYLIFVFSSWNWGGREFNF